MNAPTEPVSVWMERRAIDNRWVSHQWRAAAIVSRDDGAAGAPDWQRFDGFELRLHRDEAEGYYLNTSTANPQAFVMWRLEGDGDSAQARPMLVTLSYNEAARLMDAQEKVDAVPLPLPLRVWLEAYVVENYRPEPKKKRARASFVAPRDKGRL